MYYSDPSGTLIRCPRALIRVEATLQRQSDLPQSQRDNSLSDCSQLYVRLHAHACVVYRESFLESQRRVVAFRAPGAQPALSWPGHTLSLRTMKLALLTSPAALCIALARPSALYCEFFLELRELGVVLSRRRLPRGAFLEIGR